jgi:hypothetical protein
MAKQVLSQRDLKTQSAISVPAAGFVAIGAKADGIYSRTESGVEKRLYRRRSRWRLQQQRRLAQ